jgi:hypothetical protein
MNADHLIDYALGRLEDADRERLEQLLQGDPEASAQAQKLSRAVHLLLDDGDVLEPPAGLARRTLTLVAQSHSRSRSILDFVPIRVPFRWADLAVAASIFIAGVLTLLPAIQRSRARMSQAGCVFNLQQLGQSLAQYATLHPTYPYPSTPPSNTHAGAFAAVLHDAGVLRDFSLLDCPCNGPGPHAIQDLPRCEQLDQIRRTDPERYRHMLCWDYAYNVGYRHVSGSPRPLPSRPPMAVPVVADQPAHENYVRILDGNSPNHGRRGQNVLFSDGTVRWFPTRQVSPHDPDLYLNNRRELRPGVDEQDSVLLPSYSPFDGWRGR